MSKEMLAFGLLIGLIMFLYHLFGLIHRWALYNDLKKEINIIKKHLKIKEEKKPKTDWKETFGIIALTFGILLVIYSFYKIISSNIWIVGLLIGGLIIYRLCYGVKE